MRTRAQNNATYFAQNIKIRGTNTQTYSQCDMIHLTSEGTLYSVHGFASSYRFVVKQLSENKVIRYCDLVISVIVNLTFTGVVKPT